MVIDHKDDSYLLVLNMDENDFDDYIEYIH
jgi:hypothetical protein